MSAGPRNQGFDYRETIGAGDAGRTVLEHLALRYRHSSACAWQRRLHLGRVLLDGRPATARLRLRTGQQLVWRRPPWVEPRAPLSWALVYRDPAVLGAVKPPGLPTLPGGGFLEHSLLHLVRRRFPEAAPVHRLDRGASGVVLFARTMSARALLCEAFQRGEVEKDYRALVDGRPELDRFEVKQSIGPVALPLGGFVYAAVPEGAPGARSARSLVRVLGRGRDQSLVAVRPLTGRPHQIRIHLAAAGHPLLGEPLYGSGGLPLQHCGRPGAIGYSLHAERLAFRHPKTGERVELCCLPPARMAQC